MADARHARTPVSQGKCGRRDRKVRGVLAKGPWKGSMSRSTGQAPSAFVWIREPLVIGHIVREWVIKQRASETLRRDTPVVRFELSYFNSASGRRANGSLNF